MTKTKAALKREAKANLSLLSKAKARLQYNRLNAKALVAVSFTVWYDAQIDTMINSWMV